MERMETRLLGGHGSEFTVEMISPAELSRPLIMATSSTILILPWKKIVTVCYGKILSLCVVYCEFRHRLCL
uniref:Uncharacterized protein n=1 Tax=Setaria viridis TaxID=4556 RepID=A0A4U6T0I5_SETVI|nr:hypothetical protein SEVIR_9G012750v2 [Setaria viridis]